MFQNTLRLCTISHEIIKNTNILNFSLQQHSDWENTIDPTMFATIDQLIDIYNNQQNLSAHYFCAASALKYFHH